MLIQIGSPKEPADIVDLLLECHERIRSFTALAGRLARAASVSPEEIRDAAGRLIRYFHEALPLHVADEEESIVPRLAGRSAHLDAAFADMHRQHLEHEEPLELLLEICEKLQASPEMLDQLRPSLSSVAATLEALFATHLEQEERIVLPAIRALLTPEEQTTILSELRARR